MKVAIIALTYSLIAAFGACNIANAQEPATVKVNGKVGVVQTSSCQVIDLNTGDVIGEVASADEARTLFQGSTVGYQVKVKCLTLASAR